MADTLPKKRPEGRDTEDKEKGIQEISQPRDLPYIYGLKRKRFRGARAPLEIAPTGRLGIQRERRIKCLSKKCGNSGYRFFENPTAIAYSSTISYLGLARSAPNERGGLELTEGRCM